MIETGEVTMPFQIAAKDIEKIPDLPVCRDEDGEALRRCYQTMFSTDSLEHRIHIFLPAWKDQNHALEIAMDETKKFLMDHDDMVIVHVPVPSAISLSKDLTDLLAYVDAQPYVRAVKLDTVFGSVPDSSAFIGDARSLDAFVQERQRTFQQRLFELIDASGMDDVTVYKRANVDRKVFSRIRCNIDYQPKKKTSVAFAIALKLDMETTQDLLSRAGYTLSPSSTFDRIITYCIENGIYDMFEINAALYRYNQPQLG